MKGTFHKPEEQVIAELAGKVNSVFSVHDIKKKGRSICFFGVPRDDISKISRQLYIIFFESGYQFSINYMPGKYVLMASPIRSPGEGRWINLVLALATFFTTMFMGSLMFGADPLTDPSGIFAGLPFSLAIMTVLGAHEAGHYVVAKKHGMHTSLPYFIPFPSLIGTMGAVIKHRGPIPDRKALFDVGISGPLIGLFMSVIITVIGLLQPPIKIPGGSFQIMLSLPPLFELITRFLPFDEGAPLHPVAFAGWVGMLVTALNLIPTGQLDGGHILRAMLGEKASYISSLFPLLLISMGFYLTYFLQRDGVIWVFWGFILSIFSASGHPRPLDDDGKLGAWRMVTGAVTFILGMLCVTLTPFQLR